MKGLDWAKKMASGWSDRAADLRDAVAEGALSEDDDGRTPWLRRCLVVLFVYLLIALLLGWYWSGQPSEFDVTANAKEKAGRIVTGATTTSSLINVA